ncbi:hypothetical protein GCM10027059_26300 [Myceligenerans halotolerans]
MTQPTRPQHVAPDPSGTLLEAGSSTSDVVPPPLRHVSVSLCVAPRCTWVAELGEAVCFRHGGGEWVEDLRQAADQ